MGAFQTFKGIQFKELHDPSRSGTLEIREGRVQGRRLFLTNWTDRLDFLNAISGEVQESGENVVSFSPVTYPDFPILRAADATVKGLGKSGQGGQDSMISYDFAEISVTYKNFQFQGDGGIFRDDDPSALRTIAVSLSGSFLQGPQNHFYWKFELDGITEPAEEKREYIDEPIGIVMPLMNITITDHRVPVLNIAGWHQIVGTINEKTTEGIPPQHLLYLGLDSRISFNFTSGTPWSVTHKFVARSQSWNKALRPGGEPSNVFGSDRQWQDISPPPYRVVDFATGIFAKAEGVI